MIDPYGVLGVSRDAEENEIKKAYRTLSKRYHPDNNPGDSSAEEHFKQVQAAYEQILNERKNGYSYDDRSDQSYGGFSGYSSFYGYGQQQSTHTDHINRDLRSAAVYINNGYYAEALNVLNSMAERGARWYYYSAVANLNYGNEDIAREHAAQAVNLESNNLSYMQLYRIIESGASWYSGSFGVRSIRPFGSGSVAGRIFRVIMIIAIIRFLLYFLLYAPVLYY